jgi:hypothetical protein
VKVNAPFRYSAFGLLYSAIVMAVAGGTIVGAPCVWTGGAACPTARGITQLTDCERLMLHDSYHNYTRMCLSTAAENGCWIADRTVTELVRVLGFVGYTPGHGRTISHMIAHVRIRGMPQSVDVYTDSLVCRPANSFINHAPETPLSR